MTPADDAPALGYAESNDEENASTPQAAAPGRVQFVIDPDTARGEYANFFQIRFTPIEMVLDFCRIIPDANVVEVQTRVLIHPQQGRLLLEMLRMNLDAYEHQFGKQSAGAFGPAAGPPAIGFRTSEDLRRMGLDVPQPRRIRLPSDPSRPEGGAPPKTG